jgi:peptide/nickel transport system substrate-binding protein
MGTAALGLAGPMLPQQAAAQGSATLMKFVPQANLSALDPVWTTATVTNNHGYYVFDMLHGADEKLKPQPQMAEGHEVSADGKTWRIKLREGLTFHDGSPVRGADCAASLKRWTQRDPYGQLLGRAVEEWGAPDERTIEIKLKRPFPMMLDCLAKSDQPPIIMPERLAKTDANTQVTEMIGSGPYKFIAADFVSGSRVAYEKFEEYKPRSEPPSRNAGGKVAHFKRIEWNILPDPATAGAALTRGEVDWWERPLTDLQPMLASNPEIKQEVIDKAGRGSIIRLNHLQPPFNNPKVRAAVRMAVKQED